MKSNKQVPIILASTSPRRVELLKQVQLHFTAQSPFTDETPKKNEKPHHLVLRLAKEKALSLRGSPSFKWKDAFVLAADTIVVAPNRKTILGKPRSTQEARKMLQMLSGQTHSVYTGYCIYRLANGEIQKEISRFDKTRVTMRPFSEFTIKKYIATGEPLDKAGAYGAQGFGMALIEKIHGNYTSVIGLPVTSVLQSFEDEFGTPLFSWLQ